MCFVRGNNTVDELLLCLQEKVASLDVKSVIEPAEGLEQIVMILMTRGGQVLFLCQ